MKYIFLILFSYLLYPQSVDVISRANEFIIYLDYANADADTGVQFYYRVDDVGGYIETLPLNYRSGDSARADYSGWVIRLERGTAYDLRLLINGWLQWDSTASTLPSIEDFPIKSTVILENRTTMLTVSAGGNSSEGYIKYTGAGYTKGDISTYVKIDVNNAARQCLDVLNGVDYLIFEGIYFKEGQNFSVRLNGNDEIYFYYCAFDSTGINRGDGYTIATSGIIEVPSAATSRMGYLHIERSALMNPRFGSIPWSIGHPSGMMAILYNGTIYNEEASLSMYYNEVFSNNGKYWGDILNAGAPDHSYQGIRNSVFRGNVFRGAMDDVLEPDGRVENILIYENFFQENWHHISTSSLSVGACLIAFNVFDISLENPKELFDTDDITRGGLKHGNSISGWATQRLYLYNNTVLQYPPTAPEVHTLGIYTFIENANGVSNNITSRNNFILQAFSTAHGIWQEPYQINATTGMDLDYDLWSSGENVADVGYTQSNGVKIWGLSNITFDDSLREYNSRGNVWKAYYGLAATDTGYQLGQVVYDYTPSSNVDIGAFQGDDTLYFGIDAPPEQTDNYSPVVISVNTPTEITTTSANGSANVNGKGITYNVYFKIRNITLSEGSYTDSTISDQSPASDSGSSLHTISFTGLNQNSLYAYTACIISDSGYFCGSEIQFNTLASPGIQNLLSMNRFNVGDIVMVGRDTLYHYTFIDRIPIVSEEEPPPDPESQIQLIDSAYANANTITIPTHQAGDVIIIISTRANSTPPTIPVEWTSIHSSGASSVSIAMGYFVAIDDATVSGTWTNAGHMVAIVYRGVASIGTVGSASGLITGSSTEDANFATIALSETNGTSWVLGAIIARALITGVDNTPSGMTHIRGINGTFISGKDTRAGVTSFAATTQSLTNTNVSDRAYRTVTVELVSD